jgi:hypothetical protein
MLYAVGNKHNNNSSSGSVEVDAIDVVIVMNNAHRACRFVAGRHVAFRVLLKIFPGLFLGFPGFEAGWRESERGIECAAKRRESDDESRPWWCFDELCLSLSLFKL